MENISCSDSQFSRFYFISSTSDKMAKVIRSKLFHYCCRYLLFISQIVGCTRNREDGIDICRVDMMERANMTLHEMPHCPTTFHPPQTCVSMAIRRNYGSFGFIAISIGNRNGRKIMSKNYSVSIIR